MPPRRSARGAATAALDDLPLALALRILALLPADQRLRCAEVSRSWRALVLEPSLWQTLDLSPASGVARPVSVALLRAAAARARGGLVLLDASGCGLPVDALSAVLRFNPGVTELRVLNDLDADPSQLLSHAELLQLLRAAPALRALRADARCQGNAAAQLLSAPQLAPLRLRALRLESFPPEHLLPLRPVLADATLHPSLRELVFSMGGTITPEALALIADIAVARPLAALRFASSVMGDGCAPVLARAVADGALTQLVLDRCRNVLDNDDGADDAAPLADALRRNQTLTSLTLRHAEMELRPAAAAALLDALRAHVSLRTLNVSANYDEYAGRALGRAVAEALARVVAADAPALTSLDVSDCFMRDACLGPLVDALARNTHLRELRMHGNHMSAAFASAQLLPAVRANTGLRVLVADQPRNGAVRAALALIARR